MRQGISNITHDLKTPLTSVMGYIQLIKSNNISDREKNNYINIVEKGTRNLRKLISSFYEMSIAESGEVKNGELYIRIKWNI